ncbi:SH3 domain-containing protein [Adhaeribacter aquaticus]|uniref:SH3 domain-containing protein n=1 Tax=Adhaeribacter aquaticus TaxID=299567 RepID=UPI0012F89EDE|nr:SH3 domain-containing protein [Adhaeribacter aquaticus]
MKKILFTFVALLLQAIICFNAFSGNEIIAQASCEGVKMYRQPGTSTEVLRSLNSTDRMVVVRRFNNTWTIVTINNQVGYVLHSELRNPSVQTLALHKSKK